MAGNSVEINTKFSYLGGFGIEKESYKISSVRGGKLSKISQNGDKVSFDLDKLDEYEIIVIK